MIDYGLSTIGGNAWDSLISQTYLNPSDYDGAVKYYFEIHARNGNSTNDYNVNLMSGSTIYASIPVLKNTASGNRYRVEFTPSDGENIYFIRMPNVGTTDNVKVLSARIIVVQTGNISKTRLEVPLSSNTGESNSANVDTPFTTKTGTSYATSGGNWYREDSAMADYAGTNPFRFVGVMKTSDPSGVASFALYNATDSVAVMELTTSATDYTLCSVYGQSNAEGFHNNDNYQLAIKSNNPAYTSSYGKGRLYIYLNNLTKAQIMRRISPLMSGTAVGQSTYYKLLYSNGNYAPNKNIYFEGFIACNQDINSFSIGDMGTSDATNEGLVGTVAGADLNSNSGTWNRLRTGAITLVDGERYALHRYATTATKAGYGYLIINVSA